MVSNREEDRQRTRDERDDVELRDRQDAEGVGNRDRAEHRGAHDVGEDQDMPVSEPVDPDTGEHPEDEKREVFEGAEQRHRERTRMEDENGGERQRDERDLAPELADRLSRPETAEVGLRPHPTTLRHRVRITIRAIRLLAREERIPRPLRALVVLGVLPIPGPFDEVVHRAMATDPGGERLGCYEASRTVEARR